MKKFLILFILLSVSATAQEKCQYAMDKLNLGNDNKVYYNNIPVNGTVCAYHPNGRVEVAYGIVAGIFDGPTKMYYENGVLRLEVRYKQGGLTGIGKAYGRNGALQMETTYKDNKRDGEYKAYRFNGNLQVTIMFKDDKAISGICHHTNGKQSPLSSTELAKWSSGIVGSCE